MSRAQLRRLHVKANGLFDDALRPARLKLSTMFRMGQRFMAGEDLIPLRDGRRAIGSNGSRVLGQLGWTDGAGPMPASAFPAARIADLAKWCLDQGEYIEITILADCTPLGMTFRQCCDRVADVLGHVAGMPNVIAEICNEPEAADKNLPPGVDVWQIIDALGLRDPANRPVLMSSGAYVIVGREASFDALDIMNDHGARKPDWPGEAGKLGHFVYDGWDGAPPWPGFHGRDVHVNEDEPMGCAAVASGSRDNNRDNFEDAGAGYGLGNGSLTFHSTNGLQALPFDATELACGKRWFAGADFFPADACLGRYCHQDQPEFPLVSDYRCSEAAGRLVSDHQAFVVVAQPTAGWTAIPRNGWHIVRTGGRGNLLELAR